ncbi:MAG: exonuclease SbcCD subunit D [Bacilli bacterium]|nr:exonuclease SbcCD subunit D [Bacilli bacterium]
MVKLIHLADLHIGKKIDDYSLAEDQKFIFDKILELIDKENVEGAIIAGDVFDQKSPSQEAYELLDYFLTSLADRKIETFMIPGNHDSDERVGYARRPLSKTGIHIVSFAADSLNPVVWKGINFYLLPFVNRFDIGRALNEDFDDLETAFRDLVEKMNVDDSKCNIIVSHQAFNHDGNDPIRSSSENTEIGAVEYLPISLLNQFDYCALGHIHKKQNIGPKGRYPGSLLKYHSGEANQEKSFTILEIEGKQINVIEKEIKPLRDVRIIESSFADCIKGEESDDYIKFRLTDETKVSNVMAKLKEKYKHALSVEYPNISSVGNGANIEEKVNVEETPIKDLFAKFFKEQKGVELNENQAKTIERLLEELEEK